VQRELFCSSELIYSSVLLVIAHITIGWSEPSGKYVSKNHNYEKEIIFNFFSTLAQKGFHDRKNTMRNSGA
jgi:hypothetical protein